MADAGEVLEAVEFLQDRIPRLINEQNIGSSRAMFSRLLRKSPNRSGSNETATWRNRLRLFERILKPVDYRYKQPDDSLEDLVPT